MYACETGISLYFILAILGVLCPNDTANLMLCWYEVLNKHESLANLDLYIILIFFFHLIVLTAIRIDEHE